MAITERLACRPYVCSIGRGENPMLTTTSRQTHEIIGARRWRTNSGRKLAVLAERDRQDLRGPASFTTNKDNGDDHHHRMFANLAAAAWVGALMTSAYYVFNHLLMIS
jgi:hypothetical protein